MSDTLDARIALTGAVAHLMATRDSCTPETRKALDVALGYVQEHEEVESVTEWGVSWTDENPSDVEQEKGSEVYARGVAQLYPGDAVLMSREVHTSQWKVAES